MRNEKNKRSSCKRHEKSFLRKSPVLHVLGIMLRVCSVVRMFSAGSGTLFCWQTKYKTLLQVDDSKAESGELLFLRN